MLSIFFWILTATSAWAADTDKRQTLIINESQRDLVLQEMRTLLSGIQNILGALAKDDMAAVSQYARPLGMGMAHKAEEHLKGVLPKKFMQLGMALHKDFDRIATDAASAKDPKHTLDQLNVSMGKCAACHAAYQLRSSQ
jgi:hypothetical protein